MAINEQAFHPEAPAFARSRPDAYYAWLTSNGFPHRAAYDQTTAIFGAPKSPEQRQREAANQQQQSGFAQAGGIIAGAVAGRYVMNNAGKWIDQLTGTETSAKVVEEAAKQGGQQMLESGTIGVSRQVPPPSTTVDGSGPTVELSGKTTVIDTPVGKQQVPAEMANDEGFLKSVNWDAVGTGALSLLAAYQAYQSYKSGDKVGAGLSGATAASLGASAAGQAGVTFAGQQTLAGAAPYLGVAAGLYGGYQTAEALSDMAAGSQRTRTGVVGGATSGALIGSYFGPWGTAIGAAVGAAAGAVGSWTGSSKNKAQMMRDNIRGVLQKGQILDDKFQGTLADGTKYDFGTDGSTLKWKNIDKIAEAQPKAWNAAVPAADALAASYGFVGQKASDIAAWYAKGAVSNAGDDPNIARANMQHFAKQQGITIDLVKSKLDEALKDNRINQNKYDYYMRGANDLLGGGATNVRASQTTTPIARPKKGEVGRQSAGLYRDDSGKLVRSNSMRGALEKAYSKTKNKEKK